jgi:uncharacterized protein YbaA (DUF1428 family)
MTKYVDGYVLPIPKNKIELYRSIAERAGSIWKEHGALEYRECESQLAQPLPGRIFGRANPATIIQK